ncbi:AOC3 [Bugula neritina]|uniref:AOC3 n=1 Tax=Bugula neritina TaxID=10212 RepID=A0A7J7JZ66_BUGNE|nr:AOC3 [Bugula neritina]
MASNSGVGDSAQVDFQMEERNREAGQSSNSFEDSNELPNKIEQQLRCWKIFAIVFIVLSALLLLAVLLVVFIKTPLQSQGLFSGLTPQEADQIIKFMLNQKELKLKRSFKAQLDDNYIYSIDDELPPKSEVLQWLDGSNQTIPERKARVLLFMGETQTIEEYIVSPVPNPQIKTKRPNESLLGKLGLFVKW